MDGGIRLICWKGGNIEEISTIYSSLNLDPRPSPSWSPFPLCTALEYLPRHSIGVLRSASADAFTIVSRLWHLSENNNSSGIRTSKKVVEIRFKNDERMKNQNVPSSSSELFCSCCCNTYSLYICSPPSIHPVLNDGLLFCRNAEQQRLWRWRSRIMAKKNQNPIKVTCSESSRHNSFSTRRGDDDDGDAVAAANILLLIFLLCNTLQPIVPHIWRQPIKYTFLPNRI